jgi:aerobic carbon-monoxide dehydrogenase medium subunit
MKEVLFFAPTEIEKALQLLAEYGERATLLAGGTDLLPKINTYALKPEILLSIGSLGLDSLKLEKGELVISAVTRTAKLATDALVAEKASALAEAARRTGCMATRNAATIGGNLANASPAADLATPLLAMDAKFILANSRGRRLIEAKDFFLGPGKTVLKPDEIILEISVPSLRGKAIFLKLGRRKAMTLSVVNVAVRLDMIGGTCQEARIALGSMAPTPIRCREAEQTLEGRVLDPTLITQCAEEAIAESHPIDDQRATAWYRKKAGAALVYQALTEAASV